MMSDSEVKDVERDRKGVIFDICVCCLTIQAVYLKAGDVLASWIGHLLAMGSWKTL